MNDSPRAVFCRTLRSTCADLGSIGSALVGLTKLHDTLMPGKDSPGFMQGHVPQEILMPTFQSQHAV